MRNRLRSPFFAAAIFITLSVIIMLAGILPGNLHMEWRAGHSVLFQNIPARDWVTYNANLLVNRITAALRPTAEKYLPVVRLYISEQAQKRLMSDIPRSTKRWQQAHLVYPNGTLQRVQARHRGDNPFNWAYDKKSWRIKTRKRNTIGNTRVFNYVNPQDPVLVDTHFYAMLARNLGVMTAGTRLVELHINDRNVGVYTEVVHLDESFLRNNGFMPVNIYKGEQRMAERRFGVDFDLYNNPHLWTKTAIYNQVSKEDFSDLAEYLRRTRRAESAAEDFRDIHLTARISDWANFAVFETLAQLSYDVVHNQRLLIDPWSNRVLPIVHDPQASHISNPQDVTLAMTGSRPDIFRLYSQSSTFRLAKLRRLFEIVSTGAGTAKTVAQFRNLMPAVLASADRDPNLAQTLGEISYRKFDYQSTLERFLDGALAVERTLLGRLKEFPRAVWDQTDNGLNLQIDGETPLRNVTITFSGKQDPPSQLTWDSDGNGRISSGDVDLPVRRQGTSLRIDAAFLANIVRYGELETQLKENYGSIVRRQATVFQLLTKKPYTPLSVSATQDLTGETRNLDKAGVNGAHPNLLNSPVFRKPSPPPVVWQGRMEILNDLIIDSHVVIEPGTTVIVSPGASVVFRGPVIAEGQADAPIEFRGISAKRPWGTLAIVGAGSAGSRFSHIRILDGSGDQIGMTHYTAMLSVHDTQDVQFDHITLRNNHKMDDMMHVVYGRDIVISNSLFENALSDAIDIDVSQVRLVNNRIVRSGNDGLDLMNSQVTIQGGNIEMSGDKAISVGERSNAIIAHIKISNSKIGIEVKDDSLVDVVHTRFTDNDIQLNAYRKNWRYSSGGTIAVDKSVFTGGKSNILAQVQSSISLHDSSVMPAWISGKRISVFEVDSAIGSKARLGRYRTEKVANTLKAAKMPVDPWRRGPLP